MTPRREWFAGRDLVGVGGLPSTERRIRARAAREGWTSRDRAGRGGGREYFIGSLPDSARAALLLRDRKPHPKTPTESSAEIDAQLWAAFERRSDRDKAEAQRRIEALLAVEQLIADGAGQLSACATVATELQVSTSTIRNWRRAVRGRHRTVWAPLLMTKYSAPTRTPAYDARIYQMYRDLYCDLSRPPKSTCYHRVVRWAAKEGLVMPAPSTLSREFDRREDPHVVLLERHGDRKLAEAFPYIQRDRSGFHAMQHVNADGHKLDLAVTWPDGVTERVILMTVQDLASDAILGWRLVKAETAHEMSLCFLSVFDEYGIPDHLTVDNTLAMASKRMTAGVPHRYRFKNKEDDPDGVLKVLGVNVHFATPHHGQSKPIERFFRSIADQVSKHPEFGGAYLGNSTVTKPANYGQRTITVDQLTPIVRDEMLVFNAQLGRRGAGANGRSYWNMFDESYRANAERIRRIAPTQRRLLYLVSRAVTVDRRDGCVALFGNRYWSEEVSHLKGRKVVLRYHPTESLQEAVWVYRLDGTLVASAPIYNKAGFSDAGAAEAHNRARQQFKRKTRDLAAAARHLKSKEVAAMIPAPIAPESPATGVKRIDFTLPNSLEQLGERTRTKAKAQAAAQRVVSNAIDKLADGIEPRRRRA